MNKTNTKNIEFKIELIPSTAWGSSLKKRLKTSAWDKIRKSVYAKDGFACHICGVKDVTLEAHEVWDFNEHTHIQKLVKIVALCQPCHGVIHYGRSKMIGYGEQAKAHFLEVTQLDDLYFENMWLEAWNRYLELSKISNWTLDVSLVENDGFIVDKSDI